jgi:hypothetical protein
MESKYLIALLVIIVLVILYQVYLKQESFKLVTSGEIEEIIGKDDLSYQSSQKYNEVQFGTTF